MIDDLTQAGDSAFQWWVAASAALGCDPGTDAGCAGRANPTGWNDGLIYYDPRYRSHQNWRLYPTKRLWALGNFSRFVRPGSVRHDITGLPAGVRALAFRAGHRWSVVVVNNNPTAAGPLRMAFPGRVTPTRAYRTDGHTDLARVPAATGSGTAVTVPAPARSITTHQFTDQA